MKDTAKAAVLVGPRQIEVQEFPIPKTGKDDALLRVEACGVCASDVPIYKGERRGGGGLGASGKVSGVILGHEIVGRVERLGQRAAERWHVKEGDRIIIERWIPCGHCENCYAGDYRLCLRQVDSYPLYYGGSPTDLKPSLWGGYAEYVYLHPDTVAFKVSENTPPEQFPLFTPLGNGISWVQVVGGAGIGSTVVIEGPGPEGLAAVIAAREAGAHQVFITGLPHDEHRLKMAMELGATQTFVVGEDDIVEEVSKATDGQMAEVVLDVTSTESSQPLELALDLAATRGTVVMAAGHRNPLSTGFPDSRIMRKTLSLRGVWGRHRQSVFKALKLIESGRYPLHKLTSHHFPLEQADLALQMTAQETEEKSFHVSVMPFRER